MPLLFSQPPFMQPIDFTYLNFFGSIGPFQKPEGSFDLRHLVDNFCHPFGPLFVPRTLGYELPIPSEIIYEFHGASIGY